MKFSSTFALTAFAVTCVSADLFLPDLVSNSTCEDPTTYAKCRNNAIASNCLPSDKVCICRQADDAVHCFNSCTKDSKIYNYYPSQVQEQSKVCVGIQLSTNPAATTPNTASGSGSNPSQTSTTVSIFSGGSVLSSVTLGTAGIILGAVAYLL